MVADGVSIGSGKRRIQRVDFKAQTGVSDSRAGREPGVWGPGGGRPHYWMPHGPLAREQNPEG